jgi:hypothetical protein
MGVHERLVVRLLDQCASSGISLLYGKMCLRHPGFAEQETQRAMIGEVTRMARTAFPALGCQNRSESFHVGLQPRLKRLHRRIQPPALRNLGSSVRKVNA